MSANTAAIFDVKLPFVVVPNSGTTVNQNSPSADPVTMRDVLNLDTRNLGQLFDQAVSDGLVHAGQTLFDQPTQGVGQFLDFEPNNLLLGFREGAKPTVTDFVNALEAVDVTSGGVRLQLNNVTGTVDDTTHRVTFTATLDISASQNYFLEPGITLEQLGVNAQRDQQIGVNASVDIDFRFGLDLTGASTHTGNSNDVLQIADNGAIDNSDFFLSVDNAGMKVGINADNLNFTMNFGFLGTDVVNGSVHVNAEADVRSLPDMFGFASSQFTSATTGSLTANNAPTSFTLSHDTSFDLKFGDLDPVKLTLHAGTYNDTDSLVTALNSSIDSSTLDNFVHAANVGGKVSFIADTFSSTTLGFGSGSSETSGTSSVTASNALATGTTGDGAKSFEFSTDQSFSVVVGEHAPVKITVTGASTQDNDVALFDSVTVGGVTTFVFNQAASEAASRADLVADVNNALHSAGIDSLVDVKIADKDVDAQKVRIAPSVELRGEYNRDVSSGSLFGGGSDVGTWRGVVQLRVPLLDSGSSLYGAGSARERKHQVQSEYDADRRSIIRNAKNFLEGVITGPSRIAALQKAQAYSESALKERHGRLDAGQITTLELLDSIRNYYRVLRDLAAARYEYLNAYTKLKEAAGTLIEEDVVLIDRYLVGKSAEPPDQPGLQSRAARQTGLIRNGDRFVRSQSSAAGLESEIPGVF